MKGGKLRIVHAAGKSVREQNIFKSVKNVSLATVIEYKDKNGVRYRFDEE